MLQPLESKHINDIHASSAQFLLLFDGAIKVEFCDGHHIVSFDKYFIIGSVVKIVDLP